MHTKGQLLTVYLKFCFFPWDVAVSCNFGDQFSDTGILAGSVTRHISYLLQLMSQLLVNQSHSVMWPACSPWVGSASRYVSLYIVAPCC